MVCFGDIGKAALYILFYDIINAYDVVWFDSNLIVVFIQILIAKFKKIDEKESNMKTKKQSEILYSETQQNYIIMLSLVFVLAFLFLFIFKQQLLCLLR